MCLVVTRERRREVLPGWNKDPRGGRGDPQKCQNMQHRQCNGCSYWVYTVTAGLGVHLLRVPGRHIGRLYIPLGYPGGI